ncbi:SDR family oxidoreductase [Thiomicrorhabdus sp.]|uniref:SDR family oxidoreductase n=1 Tax=Thiomicrorhabdus sp. TaxID=2039724 RepID=UPI002AA654DB|nr:SDR family oxidoreductase [Thiomicrorhabdus sp.]
MANILIVGCGDIGCQLGSILSEQNHTVFGLRRNIEELPEKITPIQADLAFALPELPEEIDYVFYIASASKYKDSAYYQAYVLGVKHTLQALKNHNIKRFIFISSSSVFGQSDGEKVDENSPTSDLNFSTKRLLEGEELALNSNIPSTVVRFGGIYGPGRTHLIDLVLNGKAHCMEDVWSNRIHSADCAGMLAFLLEKDIEKPNSLESIYIGVDSNPTLSCEVYDWLSEQLCVPDVEHIEPKESSRQMRSNKRLSNARIVNLGYEFIYPDYQAGYLALLDTLD